MVDNATPPQAHTFASLFEVPGRTFRIPAYQRAYAWGDEQIKQFLDDLREAQDTYYLGHYLFEQSPEPDRLLIIDGQQRLTTCVLFFSALCRELSIRNDYNETTSQAATWHATFVQDATRYLPKLVTVEEDNDVFSRILAADNAGVLREDIHLTTNSQKLIKTTYLRFAKELSGAATHELLHWGTLVASAAVTHLIVGDKKQAAQLFAFQNDRGKRLTNLEIVKSYLMLQVLLFGRDSEAPEVVLPALERGFTRIYRQINEISLAEDDVLAYFWRSTLANPYGGAPVVEGIKKQLAAVPSPNRVSWIRKLVDDLAYAFEFVREIEQEKLPAAQDLLTLDNMAMSYPILLRAYRDGISRPTKERLFKFLENITFRYKLRGGRANIYDRLVHHFFGEAPALNDAELNQRIDWFVGMLRTDGWGWYWNDHSMREVLNGQFYGNPVDNYLLWRYERHLETRDYPFTKPYAQFIHQESIEHIAPQTPQEAEADSPAWPGYGVYHHPEQPEEGIASGEWLNSLGNLMLLAQGQNSRVGNRPFADKLADFRREGQLRQHRLEEFLADHPTETGRKQELWDKAAIERRHAHLLEAAATIWSLDNLSRRDS